MLAITIRTAWYFRHGLLIHSANSRPTTSRRSTMTWPRKYADRRSCRWPWCPISSFSFFSFFFYTLKTSQQRALFYPRLFARRRFVKREEKVSSWFEFELNHRSTETSPRGLKKFTRVKFHESWIYFSEGKKICSCDWQLPLWKYPSFEMFTLAFGKSFEFSSLA